MFQETSLELTLLGRASLRLINRDGSHEVTLPTRKALALLAYLALNGTTSRAELAGLLWGDSTDAAAHKNLRQEVYRLQSMPVGTWLEADRHWLGLSGEYSTDVKRLRDAAGLGDLERVIALHRGPLLEGLSLAGATDFEMWLEVEREALTNLYCEALSVHATALERNDDLSGAVAAWQRLARHDPLRESVQRELMRLHWQLGERSRALEQFHQLTAVLREEVGLEPSLETQRLAEQIRASNAPKKPHHSHKQLYLPFVGRETELAWLDQQMYLAVLTGEPGIGKTRLAQEFAQSYVGRSTDASQVLELRGVGTLSGTPYYPITSALLEYFERFPQRFDDLRPAWQRELERLLPGHDGRTREPPSVEGRGWFIEALAQSLSALVGAGGCLILDDLHHFDAASLEVMAHLLRRNQNLRVLATLLTDQAASSPVGRVLEMLADHRLVSYLPLGALRYSDVVRLLRQLAGPNTETLLPCTQLVYESIGGNPLFFFETLRNSLEAGNLQIAENGFLAPGRREATEWLVPNVRDIIYRRIERLGPGLRRPLEVASLLPAAFTLETVRFASKLDSWELLELFERAVDAELLHSSAEGYHFAHSVTKLVLLEGLTEQRKSLLLARLDLASAGEAHDQNPELLGSQLEHGAAWVQGAPLEAAD